jgi:uncharacterized protein with PQ loop repeat
VDVITTAGTDETEGTRAMDLTLELNLAVIAGSISSVIFAASVMPMLIKALRTRDLSSYSPGNLVLANLGNLVHSVYVVSLPAGPLWALHGFYLITTGFMLAMYLRHRKSTYPEGQEHDHDHASHLDTDHLDTDRDRTRLRDGRGVASTGFIGAGTR